MNKALLREWRRRQRESLRLATNQRRTYGTECAKANLREARVALAFAAATADEYDPQVGEVRLRIEPDDMSDLDDLFGDSYNPKCHPDIPAARIERERQAEVERVERMGVWGIIGEYFDGEEWQQADSVWGFVGDDWKGSGYDTDIMQSALDAAASVKVCRCCQRPWKGSK